MIRCSDHFEPLVTPVRTLAITYRMTPPADSEAEVYNVRNRRMGHPWNPYGLTIPQGHFLNTIVSRYVKVQESVAVTGAVIV